MNGTFDYACGQCYVSIVLTLFIGGIRDCRHYTKIVNSESENFKFWINLGVIFRENFKFVGKI